MNPILDQLERVRRRSRQFLLIHRLGQWMGAMLLLALGLALVDYVLELPAVLRLIVGLSGLGLALAWLVSRLTPAWRFKPPLAELALRAERLYPRLAGQFASAVEFADNASGQDRADRARSRSLAASSVDQTRRRLEGLDLQRLVNPTRTRRSLALAAVACVGVLMVILIAPNAAATSAARWFTPFSQAAWPKRVRVVNLTPSGDGPQQTVQPIDSPLKFRARVEKGHRPGMRVFARYRLIRNGLAGPWQEKLLTEQTEDAGTYERLIDLPGSLNRLLTGANPGSAQIEFSFTAGDDQSEAQRLELAAAPAITRVTARLSPPNYAQGLRQATSVNLHDQAAEVATAAALRASRVTLTVQINKPIPVDRFSSSQSKSTQAALTTLAPGLADHAGVQLSPISGNGEPARSTPANLSRNLRFQFPLRHSVQTRFHVTGVHGLSNAAERLYKLEASKDTPPTASLSEPASDQAVLPRAKVHLAALARDDIGVEQIRIELNAPHKPPQSSQSGQQPSQAKNNRTSKTLTKRTGRQPTLSVDHELDLEPLDLQPGQTLRIAAVARDVYDLAGQTHKPVRSATRTLRIISRGQLINRIRNGLADIRRQAQRLESRQAQTQKRTKSQDRSAEVLVGEQADLTRRVRTQTDQLSRLKDQAKQNRLESPDLNQLMAQASQLLQSAHQHSRAAAQTLKQTTAQKPTDATKNTQSQNRHATKSPNPPSTQATAEQGKVRENLNQLAQALAQGGSALELKAKLAQMASEQADLNQQTRKTLPRTAGQDPENLPQPLKKKLDQLNRRQQELGEQAKGFSEQARAAAEQLTRQGKTDRERAAAEALNEAAKIAQRRGLSPKMNQAARSIKQNQLSQAGARQNSAKQTLSQMSKALGSQKQKRREMLRRRLAKLGRRLEDLIQRQKTQIEALKQIEQANDAEKLPTLARPENALRQLTMGAAQTAQSNRSTAQIVKPINQAIDAQADAVRALRKAQRKDARLGQKTAVDHLHNALEQVRKQQQKQRQDEAREKRAKLQTKYQALAQRQSALREKVEPLAQVDQPTRREQAAMRSAGAEQSAIREDAGQLGEKAAKTLVFKRMHQRIDQSTRRAAESLGESEASTQVLTDQRQSARLLGAMAEALKQAKQDSEFEKNAGGGGGGGQGGQGGNKPSLIPNVAELKLLRSVQQTIYQQTRAASVSESKSSQRFEILGKRQRELHDLGNELLKKVKQSMKPKTEPR